MARTCSMSGRANAAVSVAARQPGRSANRPTSADYFCRSPTLAGRHGRKRSPKRHVTLPRGDWFVPLFPKSRFVQDAAASSNQGPPRPGEVTGCAAGMLCLPLRQRGIKRSRRPQSEEVAVRFASCGSRYFATNFMAESESKETPAGTATEGPPPEQAAASEAALPPEHWTEPPPVRWGREERRRRRWLTTPRTTTTTPTRRWATTPPRRRRPSRRRY